MPVAPRCSGDFRPPSSPPREKGTARYNQTGQPGASDRAGNGSWTIADAVTKDDAVIRITNSERGVYRRDCHKTELQKPSLLAI
jgi:hypothetical protein